ncbi:hypothetical protein D4R52_02865, partial [bacterium]
WYLDGFDENLLNETIAKGAEVLREQSKPVSTSSLFENIQKSGSPDIQALSHDAIESVLELSKIIGRNAFGLWGLASSPEISPKDVGDKAFLVLKYNGHPQHYSAITELINKQKFDHRTAHKETVHNELIKDPRFVLIGRGIYALREWGYKKGVVADIVKEVLKKAGRPMGRDEIIDSVLKQRLVKRNTIIVGLSNRKHFKKTPDNKYVAAESTQEIQNP